MADPDTPDPNDGTDPDDDSPDQTPSNPLEAIFAQLGINAKDLDSGAGLADLMTQLQGAFQGMTSQFGGLFRTSETDAESGVNWTLANDTARKVTAAQGSDPTPSKVQADAVTAAVSLAETWLDEATDFPRVARTPQVWSRADWVERTQPTWRRLVEPVASHIADAMAATVRLGPEETAAAEEAGITGLAGMEEMLKPMLRSSGSSMFGLQLGQGLGQLAAEVVGATDIGLPLFDRVALIPTNVAAFGEGLDQSDTDVMLYLALRECARQRLFAAAPWLRQQLLVMVEQYAEGIAIDTSALEQALGELDPSNITELGETLAGSLFEPRRSPGQDAVLARLETMLALVEGWVDEVVAQATSRWMPNAAALAETMRRQRAIGGPAEQTFATLVGLELRPRRLRDAANLWAALRNARGAQGRDHVWSHPDLAPTAADLDDPLGFVAGEHASADDAAPVDFDAELARLLDAEAGMDAAQGDTSRDDASRDDASPDDASPDDASPDDASPDDPEQR